MTAPKALAAIKRKLSGTLLDVPGVSGVGLRGDHVVVYLESDDPRTRGEAEAIVRKIAPSTPVVYEVTGRLEKQ